MPFEIFTPEWLAAWAARLNASAEYKRAAATWEWPIILEMEEEPSRATRQIYLDLFRGECREARATHPEDFARVPYVINAKREHWEQTLRGELDPLLALARGKLKLQKGSLFTLARYSNAAKQLVAAAREVEVLLPQKETSARQAVNSNGVAQTMRQTFLTTSGRGLRHDILPMRLYHKAKKLGVWDPRAIDFTRDREDWRKLSENECTVILHLTTLFQSGEESVTLELLPALLVMANEGRLEEEMYLSTFLFEEAKHTEFCRRFLDEVAEVKTNLEHFHTPAYRKLFYEELPHAMNALRTDASPAAQIEAAATYNMIVEGTLAETGYHAYFSMLERNDLMPGMRQGLGLLKRDEARHIAYGLYWIARLLAEEPELWRVLEKRLGILLELSLQSINEVFDLYNPMPFGLQREAFVAYALEQFSARVARLERAKTQSLAEIEQEEDAI